MLWHLAATERYYQLNTFENMEWGSWNEEIKAQWDLPLSLREEGREKIKGHNIDFCYRTGRTERLDLALGDAVKQLRNLSRELGFFVLLVWQLNRQCERRKPPIPLLSDLAGSGQAERDADIVLLLYRDEYYHGDQTAEPGKVRLISAKFRGGETGVDVLDWQGECTAIRELDSRWEGRR